MYVYKINACAAISCKSMYKVCAWLPVCHLQRAHRKIDGLRGWRMRSHAYSMYFIYMVSIFFSSKFSQEKKKKDVYFMLIPRWKIVSKGSIVNFVNIESFAAGAS